MISESCIKTNMQPNLDQFPARSGLKLAAAKYGGMQMNHRILLMIYITLSIRIDSTMFCLRSLVAA